ncbi:MAG: protein kinase [Chloroflexi bacterium]|nr:protein kinase [Chloroflexota bacterium]
MLNTTIFERYAIEEQIGASKLFIEYRGKDTQTDRPVKAAAVKQKIVPAADFIARFEPVAKVIAKVESPHTVPVLEYGDVDGQAVVVRESIQGQSLTDLAAGGSGLQIDIVLDIARQLGEYLDAIHQGSIFQGAFSPDNVLLSGDGVVRVTDLGLAQGLNIGELLAAGKIKARSSHAPELLRGEKADARTDFYSLGAVLYEVLTGKELEAGAAVSDQTLIADLFPSRLRLGVPPELDELVAKCLHPVPAKRIQSAAEFLNRIAEVHRGMAEGAQATVIGMEDSLMGQTLGAYRLVERLGQGGMATVYKGYEAALDRYVAVKVLPQFFASDPSFAQRFRREAKAVAQLNHPNIIPIYSYGEQSGITYLVMQFVEGGTLKHERGQTHSPEESLRLLLPIARALGYAHGRGIVHRDIKPSNVLMAEGNWPMLADFGLAQMTESSMKLTGTGVGLGTPMYMSPEQGRGDKVDARTDIYSLGIMLYELVTGDVPFRADTPMAIVIKHMTAPMPMPRQLNPKLPEEVENIILKATAKDADDRYQTADEMITAMERVMNKLAGVSEATAVHPMPESPGVGVAKKTRGIFTASLLVSLLCGLSGLVIALLGLLSAYGTTTPDFIQSGNDVATTMLISKVMVGIGLVAIIIASVVGYLRLRKKPGQSLQPAGTRTEKTPKSKRAIMISMIVLLSFLGLCCLGVVLMGVFDICPPVGPWPQPPWCPGSPYELPTFGGAEEPTPTLNWSATMQAYANPTSASSGNNDLATSSATNPLTCPDGETVKYTVQANDTLNAIASIFGVSIEDLKNANNLTAESISPGQELNIPLCLSTRPTCASGQASVLFEDFEDLQVENAGWSFRDDLLNATSAWPIVADENGNYVWVGGGDARAAWTGSAPYNYVVSFRMRMREIDSELYFIFRNKQHPDETYGYYFSTESGLLSKEPPGTNLARADQVIKDLIWHDLVISAIGNQITISMDGANVLQVADSAPFTQGWIEFQSRRGQIWYDDILICSLAGQ